MSRRVQLYTKLSSFSKWPHFRCHFAGVQFERKNGINLPATSISKMIHCLRSAFVSSSLIPKSLSTASRTAVARRSSSFVPRSTFRRPRFIPIRPHSHAASTAMAASNGTTVATPTAPQLTYLKDYKPPSYLVDTVRLEFDLDDEGLDTKVKASLTIRADCSPDTPLELDGENVELLPGTLAVNGTPLSTSQYTVDPKKLTIPASALPASGTAFTLTSEVRVKPTKNTALEGLYFSTNSNCFVTQCEAEGFRKITYFPDRPDVMSTYSVRISASKSKYPILLSNGNCVDSGDLEDGKHFVEYEDPHKKPCYLFALVGGDLAHMKDTFTTMNGRQVNLVIYVKGESEVPKCKHAMESLKKSMKWDEDVYGLEYDLDIFNIVAVPDFTMGAMENKSLNIFNSKYILGSSDTATDGDFNRIEGVVAHEYFHNYSGNRVTVSSWFQLSLKEGLTVFRDQSFSSDMNSATPKRIDDVYIMRSAQFAEDSGPMSHPIQPKQFQTINNFYTVTVYDKGAEVIRMLHTLCGPKGYRRGTDIYFKRHDGQAITTNEWLQAIHDANPDAFDLAKFKRWYDQAGTPSVTVTSEYDAAAKTLTLNMSQVVPPTHKQPEKLPALIPVKTGIIGPDGKPVAVDIGDGKPEMDKILILQEEKDTFVLHNVPEGSMPSMLRGWSAPVNFKYEQGETIEALAFQMANDADEFNSWEAGQKLCLKVINECLAADTMPEVPAGIVEAFRKALSNTSVDAELRACLFGLPSESYILEQASVRDPVKIRAARNHLKLALATGLEKEFLAVLDEPVDETYSLDTVSQGKRAMRNTALAYLGALKKEEIYEKALAVVRAGRNMTEVQSALTTLAGSESTQRDAALKEFADKWNGNQLVLDKWLRTQSSAPRADALEVTKKLMEHEAFKITVPNCVYALFGGYMGNMHIPTTGEGYEFIADQVLALDKINPQVASRIARVFTKIKKYDENRQSQMREQLIRIKGTEGLSKDVTEIVGNCLEA